MTKYRSPAKAGLRVNDLLFVNAYLANGQNSTQAYRAVHPKASYKCANVEAVRVLAKPSVQGEIAKRVRCAGGITKAFVESALLTHYRTAEEKGDYLAGASIAMDCAKLAGLLVEKREIKTLSDDESNVIRSLVRSSLGTKPILPPSTSAPSSPLPSAPSAPATVDEHTN